MGNIWAFFFQNVSVHKKTNPKNRGQGMTFLVSFPLAGITEQWAQLGLYSGHSEAITKVMERILLLLFSLSRSILTVIALHTGKGCWLPLLPFSWLFWDLLHCCGKRKINGVAGRTGNWGEFHSVLVLPLMPGPALQQTFRNVQIK